MEKKQKYKPKQKVVLKRKDKQFLETYIKKGLHNARCITRAKILLRSHAGETDVYIANQEGCTRTMSRDVRIRYNKYGLNVALYDRPRSGQPPKLDAKAEAYLIATACSDSPEGSDHWTLALLQEKMIADKKVESISTVALWHRLKKHDIKPWREKNVVYSEANT